MRYELELFTGDNPPYTLTRYEYTNQDEALKAYFEKRQEPGAVWASLIEWDGNCGALIRCGWCR